MKTDASGTVAADKPVRRRVRLDPVVRRQQIVAQATRLIAHSGFNAVSLADIANACDIRKSSVLHYFPSMKALLVAILEQRDESDFKEEQSLGNLTVTASEARAGLTARFAGNLEQLEILRLFHVLAAEALTPEHPAHDYFRIRSQRAKSSLAQVLAWKANTDAAALELLAFWQGLEMQWLIDPQADVLSAWHNFADRFFSS